MKKIVLAVLGASFLISCSKNMNKVSEISNQDTIINETPSIGGNKDENGCLTGAGLRWSKLKQDCIQIFNEGLRLNPTNINENEAVISSFVLFSDDKSKVELFIANDNNDTFILNITNNNIYQDDIYKYDANKQSLYINGVEKYKAEKKS